MSEMTFEKALEELERVVARLEKEGVSLNESLALFEKGVKLARFLREELDKAERKVEKLNLDKKDEKGEYEAEPFELEGNEEEGKKPGRNRPAKKSEDDVPF
jgi:exodeoxyribonuclease VII small subunit